MLNRCNNDILQRTNCQHAILSTEFRLTLSATPQVAQGNLQNAAFDWIRTWARETWKWDGFSVVLTCLLTKTRDKTQQPSSTCCWAIVFPLGGQALREPFMLQEMAFNIFQHVSKSPGEMQVFARTR